MKILFKATSETKIYGCHLRDTNMTLRMPTFLLESNKGYKVV